MVAHEPLLDDDPGAPPAQDDQQQAERVSRLQERSLTEGWRGAPLGRLRPSTAVIYPYILLNGLPGGLAFGVLPLFEVQFFSASDCDVHEDDDCGDFSSTSFWNASADSLSALMCVLLAQSVGLWADRRGRRPVLIAASVATFLPYLALYVTESLYPYYAFSIAGGAFGTSMAMNPGVGGYLSDVTTEADRSRAFSVRLGMQLLALAVAPLTGAILGELMSDRQVFGISAALGLLNVLYAALLVPESLPPEQREAKTSAKSPKPWQMLAAVRKAPRLMQVVCVITFLASLPESGVLESAVLFLDDQLGLDDGANALFAASLGVLSVVTSIWGLPVLKRHVSEFSVLKLALFCNAAHMINYASAAVLKTWLIIIPLEVLASLTFLYSPTMQAMISRRLPQHEQGIGLGLLTAVTGFTGVLGPLVFGWLYGVFRKDPYNFPELPFLVGAAMSAAGLYIAATRLPRLLAAPMLADRVDDDEEDAITRRPFAPSVPSEMSIN